ncbi:unnamed protein product, partial [Ectocarpus sp. 8 AP-2014]
MSSQWAAHELPTKCPPWALQPRTSPRGEVHPHINLELRPAHQSTSERYAALWMPGTRTMARRAAFLLLPTAAVALAQSSSETTGYLGCYTNRNDRIFSGPMTASADNSPGATYKAACEGYAFYGLQYGKQ